MPLKQQLFLFEPPYCLEPTQGPVFEDHGPHAPPNVPL